MFDPLKTEIEIRFTAVEDFFTSLQTLPEAQRKTAKGLAFVHMYAVYEYTVVNAVRTTIDVLVSHKYKNKSLAPSLMVLFLDSRLQTLRDCGNDRIWERRLELAHSFFSEEISAPKNALMPHDGTHFKRTQIELLLKVFGIRKKPVTTHDFFRMDEVVDKRNAVAHGRETAEDVGGGFTEDEILQRIRRMKRVCLGFAGLMEEYCSNKKKHCRKKG